MKKITRDDPEAQSANLIHQNVEQLKLLFPEAFTEGKVDFEVLKQLLGGAVDEREEKYGLNWHGKRRARQIALTPSLGTLRPCPEESVDWDTTQNLMIEGDNLEVLKLLQKSYAGKVKMIYIDPPYNTGRDFIYPDDFHDNIRQYLRLTGQLDQEGTELSSNKETSGRFHTNWLNMIYPRIRLARDLLCDTGVIVISIDDNEIHNLLKVGHEIFGEDNFLGCVIWQKKDAPANDTIDFSTSHDYLVFYAKSRPLGANSQPESLLNREERSDRTNAAYKNPDSDPRGPWRADNYKCNKTAEERPNLYYPLIQPNTGEEIWPQKTSVWRYNRAKHEQNILENRIWWGSNGDNRVPAYKRFLNEVEGVVAQTIWLWNEVGHNDEAKKEIQSLFPDRPDIFQTPKPTRLLRKMLSLATTPDSEDIVLDFFAGSGTTCQAVLDQNASDDGNRRFIAIQLPEVCDRPGFQTIADITKERVRRAAARLRSQSPLFGGDLGFRVFKLDSSNINAWDPDRDNIQETLLASVEHLKTDRSEQDILFEVLLKLGLELTVPMEVRTIANKQVRSIGLGSLLVCLDPRIARADVEALAHGIVAWHEELAPAGETQIVFRDSAFADDVAKTNLTAILQQYGLTNVRSL